MARVAVGGRWHAVWHNMAEVEGCRQVGCSIKKWGEDLYPLAQTHDQAEVPLH